MATEPSKINYIKSLNPKMHAPSIEHIKKFGIKSMYMKQGDNRYTTSYIAFGKTFIVDPHFYLQTPGETPLKMSSRCAPET